MLLLVQAVFGAAACPGSLPSALNSPDSATYSDTICTHGTAPVSSKDGAPEDGPSKSTQHQCPACLSFVCHVSAILAAETAVPGLSEGVTAFVLPSQQTPASIHTGGFHNRGPPLSLHA